MLILTLSLIAIGTIQSAYATVPMYNTELNCPVESLDFTGVQIEFDAIDMCPVVGNIIGGPIPPFIDPIPGGSGFGSGQIDYQEYVRQLENMTDVIQQLTLLEEMMEFDLRGFLGLERLENIELQEEVDKLKRKIDFIIEQLKRSLEEADTLGVADRLIPRGEIERIFRDVLNLQFILPAYAVENSISVIDQFEESKDLLNEYRKLIAENAKLDRTLMRLSLYVEIVEKVYIEIEIAIKLFLLTIGR